MIPSNCFQCDCSKRYSSHLYSIIATADADVEVSQDSQTDLDSHANMAVVGKNALIIHDTGESCDVRPFSPDYKPLNKIKIVDAVVCYECPHSNQEYMLVLRNCLHVPKMKNNLIPPFIMREAGIIVNDVPKIHVEDPSADENCIIISKWGIKYL